MIRLYFFTMLFGCGFAFAQDVDVHNIKGEGTTTIEVRKGEKAKNEAMWEVVEGTADIQGEHNPVKKEARADWKKACDTWKKEFKDDNKENKILGSSCGNPVCVAETEGTQCKSQAVYKIKTKIN